MISISKEQLDRVFFRYDSNRFTDKLMGVIKFSFIPLCIIEGIAAVLLTYKHSLILTLLLFFGFIILDIIAAFIFGIVVTQCSAIRTKLAGSSKWLTIWSRS